MEGGDRQTVPIAQLRGAILEWSSELREPTTRPIRPLPTLQLAPTGEEEWKRLISESICQPRKGKEVRESGFGVPHSILLRPGVRALLSPMFERRHKKLFQSGEVSLLPREAKKTALPERLKVVDGRGRGRPASSSSTTTNGRRLCKKIVAALLIQVGEGAAAGTRFCEGEKHCF